MLIRDGAWTLYDHDMASGRCVWHHFDGEKDVYRVDYPVDNLISENRDVRNSAEKVWRGDWHRVASIPLNVAHSTGLVEAHSQGDDRFVKRFLNDGDNRAWRTKDGQL